MADSAITALLIEDNPGDARLLQELLRESQAPITIAHTDRLAAGLAYLAQGEIDVVLLDLSLPDSQGLSTFNQVHAAAPAVPIVVLTGLNDETVALQALQAGAQDYLVKGQVAGDSLARALRYAIERQRLHDQLERATWALREERSLLARRVTERTADLSLANAELARAARLKDEFLASMSHELRTPLTNILGRAEALQEAIYGPVTADQMVALHGIAESGQHLLTLINDILDISKIESGQLSLDYSLLDVEMLCTAALRMVTQVAMTRRIGLVTSYDSRVESVHADERRLKQILVNLLSNAVKFTPEGGQVGLEVSGDPEQQVATFAVWDTGIGITAEDLPRLFQPFVQLDSSLNRQYSGTGLGLALVARLIKAHGGSVAVESTPGQGSRFSVTLSWPPDDPAPQQPVDRPEPQLQTAPAVGPAAQRPRILLADDNEAAVEMLADYLHAKGYELIVARDGHEALMRARQERPDVILMDVQMPGMDGLEVIRRLRAEAGHGQVPILAITALAMPGDRERCLAAGADEYLPKPFHLPTLLAAIERQR